MALHLQTILPFILVLAIILSGQRTCDSARVFTIVNYCKETLWPAVTPGESFNGGGFVLKPGESAVFTAPVSWSGRIWARTGCKFDQNGNGNCQTGSCGTTLKCSASGKTPASLAEFTLAQPDFYDVSLVDGFNVPMAVKPINGKGNCSTAGCDSDLRNSCPKELSLRANGKTVGCRSACDVFNTDEYCCKGNYGNPSTCKPTFYSKKFKEACPTSYSYAYDDPTSIFTCTGTDYVIAFCSSRKQQVCSYHNNKLHCSGSQGLKSLTGRWWIVMMITVFSVLSFWIGF
ncbi:hypothetical protein AAZX31_13G066800 [Glycine max]|uniref:Thaumatin-like protein n=2 Tax=Glycine subgen. Soja TaxID=1462606 RepID=K7LX39_SOYBN|nr:pathogenesis-related thaumatin-like protein 3.5 [Glycine max]XP_028196880.1 pathogenesis-related protein 5-like [Glycine soja]KAG4958947.1 hypothetical protein JHK87_035580 [Glycine soja]KAG4976311.1 hypothetical protein JHK86_035785 [Glycine max]KAG5112383.1 hypothetical protein JHK82_035652 [Glycine max]KAG5129662.1 hypothetical protein JHK84_036059 [Glycine max]KAH1100393.1 hypothetical protein GYH30_035523 [Glycine max]|eukprot:XP_003543788.1 pathogenesis-related protein 5 [Glycine max]